MGELSDLHKREVKDLGDAIGMPDEQDKKFIQGLIKAYDLKYPGYIANAIKEARKDQADISTAFKDVTEFGETATTRHGRHLFELPASLVAKIEEYYPTMFRSKKHFEWFCRHFKNLMLPRKY